MIPPTLAHAVDKALLAVHSCAEHERVAERNTQRVLDAMRAERISAAHMAGSTGYGYDDIGRDAFERTLAAAFGAQTALARPSIASGTHAIATALYAMLEPGDTLVYATGAPYDTLADVIGHKRALPGSLARLGVAYREIPLTADDAIDLVALEAQLIAEPSIRLVALQRSRGYAWRSALSVTQLAAAAALVRRVRPKAAVLVDNCYGEFVEDAEPCGVGAHLAAGSLIKNPGGGIAPTGGYIVGEAEAVARCAARLYAPGIGGEVGSYEGGYRSFYQGLFMAPHTVLQALKTAVFASALFSELGFEVSPLPNAFRGDIITAIRLGSREALCGFCAAIQAASPVDGHVVPEAWRMPGYENDVIMAAGTFVQGASIELSADGPMVPPYIVYLQGGLTWEHGKLALIQAAESVLRTREG